MRLAESLTEQVIGRAIGLGQLATCPRHVRRTIEAA